MNVSTGAMLIVAGTTIGAGMLALPLATAPLGLSVSAMMMFFWWSVMLYSAVLMVRLCRLAGDSASLPRLYRHFGPRYVEGLLAGVLCFLFYALIAAYLTGGASLLHVLLPEDWKTQVPQSFLILILTILFASLIASKRHFSDIANRIMITVKLFAFLAMLYFIFPFLDSDKLFVREISWEQSRSFWTALPIVFTSFGFHGSIPSILKYTGLRNRSVYSILAWGSLLPCFVYLLWIMASVGVIPQTGEHSFATIRENGQDVGMLIDILRHISQSSFLMLTSSLFSLLAIATSLLGVGLGLFDFFQERISGTFVKSLFATFLIPFLFAQFYPQGFIIALGLASIALSLLAVIFPALLCLKLGKRFPLAFPGEQVLITLLLFVGFAVIGIEVFFLG